jgi:hypothetical protein
MVRTTKTHPPHQAQHCIEARFHFKHSHDESLSRHCCTSRNVSDGHFFDANNDEIARRGTCFCRDDFRRRVNPTYFCPFL